MEEACNQFRSYLHSSGVADALAASLTSLYQLKKKPENPVEFIRQNLPPTQEETISGLTNELAELTNDIDKLREMLPKDAEMDIQEDELIKTESKQDETEREHQIEYNGVANEQIKRESEKKADELINFGIEALSEKTNELKQFEAGSEESKESKEQNVKTETNEENSQRGVDLHETNELTSNVIEDIDIVTEASEAEAEAKENI